MTNAEAARDWLCTPEAQVSAHYVISPQGTVWHLVDDVARAWHAGVGQWGKVTDVNSHSIGIELGNSGSAPFSEPLMASLESLLSALLSRWSIPPERVIGHSDMAPGRKIDPGPRFDWRRLGVQNLAALPDFDPVAELRCNTGEEVHAAFEQALQAIGYTPLAPFAARLAAFRARFLPQATGPVSGADLTLAQSIAHDYPVDQPSRFA
ncbi:MAG: N-acetylmuramoyl-L-alanine amidase [Rhodobacteraceae bacterium]|nr:N-acetylmuramoyl-L-alanine amidase [Paracoccaceae bacterium]